MEDDVEKVDIGNGLELHTLSEWQSEVYNKYKDCCCNCGSSHKIKIKLIVPEDSGGQKSASNAYLICRSCELASSKDKMNKHTDNRPINIWVSRRLFNKMNNGLCSDWGFKSKSALIRYLMGKYIQSENQYDDLEQYQDSEGADAAKVNAWVPKEVYSSFQALIKKRGMTVTEAVKSLVMVFEEEHLKLKGHQ